jgi:hypothetical protein
MDILLMESIILQSIAGERLAAHRGKRGAAGCATLVWWLGGPPGAGGLLCTALTAWYYRNSRWANYLSKWDFPGNWAEPMASSDGFFS